MTNRNYDIALLIPLKEELKEFFSFFPTYKSLPQDESGNIYYELTIGKVHVVVHSIGDTGPVSAAVAIIYLLDRFSPRLVVVLGIAGALDLDLKIGDIVVGSHIDHYMHGAKAVDGTTGFTLSVSGKTWPAPWTLIEVIQNLEFISPKSLKKSQTNANKYISQVKLTAKQMVNIAAFPTTHVGPIASGDIVGASDHFVSFLLNRNRKYAAIEMEAAGPASVAHRRRRGVAVLTIRGISDFSRPDKKKWDTGLAGKVPEGFWRRYALNNASCFFSELLQNKQFCIELKELPNWVSDNSSHSSATLSQNIPRQLKKAKTAVSARFPSEVFVSLKARRDFDRPDALISPARRELFLVGVNLEIVCAALTTFMDKVRAGVNLRLLCLDPDGETLAASSAFSGVQAQERRRKITKNIELLCSQLRTVCTSARWELRVVDSFLSAGVIAVDPNTARGCIIAQNYLYATPAEHAPTITIHRKTEGFWFSVYLNSLEVLWDAGRTIDSQPKLS